MGYDRDYGRSDRGEFRGQRDDPRYGERSRFGRDEGYGGARGRDHDDRGFFSGGRDRDDDRGFFDRAGDEVRSWFGDEEAERRRRYDEMNGGGGYSSDRDLGRNRGDFGRSGPQERDPGQRGHMSGGYGGSSQAGSRSYSGSGAQGGQDYDRWRRQQIEALDRDYDEYRRENHSRFESEFGGWREKRQTQRAHMGKAAPDMEVIGSDGQHLGTVDKVRGDRIILTKNEPNAGGHHHSIPCGWIDSVDDKVRISKTAEDAKKEWRDEERRQALFSEDHERSEGPHVLNRSFSGTYEK